MGIFPDRNAAIRLVGAVLAEQHDDWIETRRYMGLDLLKKSRVRVINPDPDVSEKDTPTPALTA